MLAEKSLWQALPLVALLVVFSSCTNKPGIESKEPAEISELTRAYVTTQDTIVRSGPGSEFKPLAKIGPDAKVDIIAKQGEWLLIVSKKGNAPGFIDAGTVQPAGADWEPAVVAVEGPYRVLADTQVRSGPGAHYEVVANVPKGIKINVIGSEEGWLKVQSKHGKPPGYVDGSHAQPMVN